MKKPKRQTEGGTMVVSVSLPRDLVLEIDAHCRRTDKKRSHVVQTALLMFTERLHALATKGED